MWQYLTCRLRLSASFLLHLCFPIVLVVWLSSLSRYLRPWPLISYLFCSKTKLSIYFVEVIPIVQIIKYILVAKSYIKCRLMPMNFCRTKNPERTLSSRSRVWIFSNSLKAFKPVKLDPWAKFNHLPYHLPP